MTVAFYTLGCKLNQSETEALAEAYSRAGCGIVSVSDTPDLVIINSCTVTGRGDAKSRHSVRHAARLLPNALIVLTGCYAEVERESLTAELAPEQVAIVPQSSKPILKAFAGAAAGEPGFAGFSRTEKKDFLRSFLGGVRAESFDPFALAAEEYIFHTRAFLKIQDGCDAHCAYCRVPLARGPARSLHPGLVRERLGRIVGRGVREIVLTGVNISSYEAGGLDLAGLIGNVLAHTRHVRFRLSSIEPEALTPRLFEALADPAVCPHFHIPVQSGSAAVLSRMRRRYAPAALREGLAGLRRTRPEAFISADVIVGFPGEGNAEFDESKRLLEALPLDGLHVFPFSARPGTAARTLSGQVQGKIVRERVRSLIALHAAITKRFLDRWLGQTIEVILEQPGAAAGWNGSSAQSFKCLVEGMPDGMARAGLLVQARVRDGGVPCRADFLGCDGEKPEYNADGK